MKRLFVLVFILMLAMCVSAFAEGKTEGQALEKAGLDGETLSDIGFLLKHIKPLTPELCDEASRCLKASAALGNARGMVQLGEMYAGGWVPLEKGEDTVQQAIRWWEAGGEHGDGAGYYNLGLLYHNAPIPGGDVAAGHNFVPQDDAKALTYFKTAFDKGAVKAGRYIGLFYEKGIVVKQDFTTAAKYFEAAASRGDSTSKFYYANYLLEGKGTSQDIKKAMGIYQDVVDKKGHDIGNCANALGRIYEEGKYVPADHEKAVSYYLIGAAHENAASKQALADYAAGLYKQGIDQLNAGDCASAIPLFIQAANLGNTDALKMTGSGEK